MSFLQKFLPKTPIPGIFRVESVSKSGKTRLTINWNLDGEPGERVQDIDKGKASLLDVLESFPGVEDKIPMMAKAAASHLPLPPNWVLECKPAPKGKEGFLLTFDVGIMHWDKHLEVTDVQLNHMADLIGWVSEASKVDRHRAR